MIKLVVFTSVLLLLASSAPAFTCPRFGLKSVHGKFLSAQSNGDVMWDRSGYGPWETISFEPSGSDPNKGSFKSTHGKYLCAESNNQMKWDRSASGPWETFTIEQHGDKVAIKTVHGRYISAQADGSVDGDRTAVGPWEKFTIYPSTCQECPAGEYGTGTAGACGACAAGTFSGSGATSCSNCPAGKFSSAGSASCAACPAGTFSSGRSGDCGECPENTYSPGASSSCLECPNNSTSPAGSTSDADCSPVNGAHCWEEYDNVRMPERYGDALDYDAAIDACFEDHECSAVSCRRRRGQDECYLSKGEEHEIERNSWYVHVKMEDCYGG